MKYNFIKFVYDYMNEHGDKFCFDYGNGRRGHAELSYYTQFPKSKKDLGFWLDVMDVQDANRLLDFFKYMIERLDAHIELAKKHAITDDDIKLLTDAEADKKRTLAMIEAIEDRYDISADVETEEVIKMKKVDVYSCECIDDDTRKAEHYTGKLFKKYDRDFAIYKKYHTVYIILPEIGYAIKKYTGRITDAPQYVDDKLIAMIENIERGDDYETWSYNANKMYRQAIQEAGYEVPKYIPEFVLLTVKPRINKPDADTDASREVTTAAPDVTPDCDTSAGYTLETSQQVNTTGDTILDGFINDFNTAYDDIYNSGEDSYGGFLIDLNCQFDKLSKTDTTFMNFLKRFIDYRQDYLTSDRERAAFMIAYEKMQSIAGADAIDTNRKRYTGDRYDRKYIYSLFTSYNGDIRLAGVKGIETIPHKKKSPVWTFYGVRRYRLSRNTAGDTRHDKPRTIIPGVTKNLTEVHEKSPPKSQHEKLTVRS